MPKLKAGDSAYIVESNRIIRPVKIVNNAGGMYLIRFDTGGGVKVKEHRLSATGEETKAAIAAKQPV